jgi:polyisoprenyl-phosphate glycosyltransferase
MVIMATDIKTISLVSPAYNEAKNIPLVIEEINRVFETLGAGYNFEYIIVNDGSSDATWETISQASLKDTRIKGVCLSRNFGHQVALTAGLDHAKGDAVIYFDSDLQHPPHVFLDLIKKWNEGYNVVHTKRVSTQDISPVKSALSSLFYKVINILSDIKVEQGMADFKLLDKKVYTHLVKFREVNRFLRGIVPWLGFKHAIVEYSADKRMFGVPGYSFAKSLGLAKVGILSFSIKPLKYIGYFGIALTLFATCFITFSIIYFFRFRGWYFSPLVNLVMFNAFLIGLVLICMGIMALYLSYIYNEVVNRPLYIVADTTNL